MDVHLLWKGSEVMFANTGLGQVGHEACVRLLVSQIRALQRSHRAGITPHYGQLEQLFDTTDVVERQLDAADVATPRPCDTACGNSALPEPTKDGRYLCADCIAKAIASLLSAGAPVCVARAR